MQNPYVYLLLIFICFCSAATVRFSDPATSTPQVDLATVRSAQLLQKSAEAASNSVVVARNVLNQLREQFHALPEYTYSKGKPSHKWLTEASQKSFIESVALLCEVV